MVLFPNDPFFSESEAREVLRDRHARLAKCVRLALESIKAIVKERPIVGRAINAELAAGSPFQTLMNCLVVQHIREEFGADELDIEHVEDHGFFELRVQGTVDLRFKQIDGSGRSRNTPTTADQLYRNQLPLIGESRIDTARLTVGWQLDAARAEALDIQVSYVKGDDVPWKYSILDAEDMEGGADPIPMPTPLNDQTPGSKYRSASDTTDKKSNGEIA